MRSSVFSHLSTLLPTALAAALLLTGCASAPAPGSSSGSAVPEASLSGSAASSGDPKPAADPIQFPRKLEDGRLTVDSLFQFSGFNPDCGNAEGEDVAALQIKNTSVLHLTDAELTLTLEDGSDLTFSVRDLPAGASAMVFSAENVSIPDNTAATALTCRAAFEENTPLAQDILDLRTDYMTVTVTNRSDRDLEDVKIHCHSLLEQDCYGGLTYEYTIEHLAAGETTAVEAADCYLGGAMVVRIGDI